MNLMKSIRNAITDGSFPQFVQNFMLQQFPQKDYPKWVRDALEVAGVSLC